MPDYKIMLIFVVLFLLFYYFYKQVSLPGLNISVGIFKKIHALLVQEVDHLVQITKKIASNNTTTSMVT